MRQAPVRLYLDLLPDTHADLEAFSRAAIEFAEFVKEIAFIIDPSSNIRVEMVRGDEGSWDFKSLIKLILGKQTWEEITLKAILFAAVMQVTHFGYNFAQEVIFDYLKGGTETHLSDKDIERLAHKIWDIQKTGTTQPRVRRFYRELTRDPAVSGVAITEKQTGRPEAIVPRPAIEDWAREIKEEPEGKRTRTEPTTVTLLSPFLSDEKRRWKLRGNEGEFGALIKDEGFLQRALAGQLAIPLMAGIRMNVLLETKEQLKGGVWVPEERNVLEVYSTDSPHAQGRLDLDLAVPAKPKAGGNDNKNGPTDK